MSEYNPVPRTEDEEELLQRFKDADDGRLAKKGLAFDVFYDEEDDLHIAIFPTPKDGVPPDQYLAFVPVRIGGHSIPSQIDEQAAVLLGLKGTEYHVLGKEREFVIDQKMVKQAPYMVKDIEHIPQVAIEIWDQNR